MNQLDICKCIHSIYYMISKEVALSVEILITMETYEIYSYTLEEPLTKLSTPILVLRRLHILVIHLLNQLLMK